MLLCEAKVLGTIHVREQGAHVFGMFSMFNFPTLLPFVAPDSSSFAVAVELNVFHRKRDEHSTRGWVPVAPDFVVHQPHRRKEHSFCAALTLSL